MDRRPELTREQLQLIYDNTSDLVFLINVEGHGRYRVESVNRAYLERTRLESEQIVGRAIDEFLDPDEYRYVQAQYDRAVTGGEPYNYETRTTMRGETIYLNTTLVPVYEEDRCTHLIGVSRDLTENKRERQALAQEKRRAENYLDVAEAIILALDRDARVTMLNRKGYRLLGYPDGSLIGRSWADLCIAPAKREQFDRNFRDSLETGEVGRNVNYILTRSGERILMSWANAFIRDDDGNIVGVLSSGEDITDRRRAEQAMIASQRVLAADEVVSAVAHDFNNSLQGILGNVEMALAAGPTGRQARDYLQTAGKLADDAARRLRSLRSIDRAPASGDFEALDLHELIDDVVSQTRPLWKDEAQRRGHDIRLQRHYAGDVQPLEGNRSELRTVLYNVMKNAIEAIVDAGEIRMETAFEDGFDIVRITDTGRGMDADTVTRVFQPFFSTKGLESGRGLGMSASHRIVRAHRGDIRVARSSPGAGTTMEIRLPAAATAEAGAPADAGQAEGPRHRILWVDDDPEIRSLAASYLRALGQDGDVADGGTRALELLEQRPYTLVITDVGMPGMTGLELAERILGLDGSRPPVIALTGWGDTILENDSPPPGVLEVMGKPIRLDRLREIIETLPAAAY